MWVWVGGWVGVGVDVGGWVGVGVGVDVGGWVGVGVGVGGWVGVCVFYTMYHVYTRVYSTCHFSLLFACFFNQLHTYISTVVSDKSDW